MTKAIPGMKDLLPQESPLWQKIEQTAKEHFSLFHFSEIRTPLLEATELFVRGIGTETGVVKKEMYTFLDKGGESVTLRPEGTASVVRALNEHSLDRQEPLLKLYYMGPMFRYERPQKGRLRQFHQIGCELFGSSSAHADGEVIAMADGLVKKLGISDTTLEINTLGCSTDANKCRPLYQEALKNYFSQNYGAYCADCQRRIEVNPMRVFDCKVPECKALSAKAPEIFSYLCENCGPHFEMVKQDLKALNVSFVVNSRIARGLDYYDQTAFEFISHNLGAQNAFGGGGRYNGLVKSLGGPDLPAIGFAFGVERLVLLMGKEIPVSQEPKVFVAYLGEGARGECVKLAVSLRERGLVVEMEYEEKSLKSQMRRADRQGFSHVVIVGEEELKTRQGMLKNLKTKEQTSVSFEELPSKIKNP